jgi:phosphoribosylamine--glycine ligase
MNRKTVLIVGSGGREHALGWALQASAGVERVDAAPGNPGLGEIGRVQGVASGDLAGVEELVREENYDLVVIGPEQPLAQGLADRLRDRGATVFGPGEKGARLEASKAFAKDFMARHGIPTAAYRVVGRPEEALDLLAEWGPPVVVKASGLAAGKGVAVAETEEEARRAIDECMKQKSFGEAGLTVVMEKLLEGEEASVFVITDGRRYHLLPGSQDHKRAYDGDAGPNTGGMGALSPAPILTPEHMATVETAIVRPTLEGLRAEGIPFRGLLYLGLMITESGPELLEYNVRFGDPETQAVLPRLGFDLARVLFEAAQGELGETRLDPPAHEASACVVAAAADYPRSGAKGLPIRGVEEARKRGALVFHAGTARRQGDLVTNGGRVLNVVGVGDTLRGAVDLAYEALERIHFDGMRFRRDIGDRALAHVTGA